MKPIRIVWTLAFAVVLLALPGLASAQASAAVSGTLTYRDRVALPANAVVTVQIARVVLDRPAEVIAEQSFTSDRGAGGQRVPGTVVRASPL